MGVAVECWRCSAVHLIRPPFNSATLVWHHTPHVRDAEPCHQGLEGHVVGRNVGAFLASESNRVEMHGARDVPHLITGSPHVATMAKVYPQRLAAFH